MNFETQDRCPRCGAEELRTWDQLSDEEREVVRRLGSSADYPIEERIAYHRWCVRCWYEEPRGASKTV